MDKESIGQINTHNIVTRRKGKRETLAVEGLETQGAPCSAPSNLTKQDEKKQT